MINESAKRITREELYLAVWSKPLKALAHEWNTNSFRLVQACQEMEVPRPSQGHWQLIARGQTIEMEPLPARTSNVPADFLFTAEGVRQKASAARPPSA